MFSSLANDPRTVTDILGEAAFEDPVRNEEFVSLVIVDSSQAVSTFFTLALTSMLGGHKSRAQ
jgi:hypothetical protein